MKIISFKKKTITPIFIISYNRKWQLEKSIKSYKKLNNIEIVIHDNGSDIPEVVEYLHRLEDGGMKVYFRKKINVQLELNNINETIDDYFKKHKKVDYVVTDPDIELVEDVDPDCLETYKKILYEFNVESVGPMLKIDDIPKDYPLITNVYNRHIEQFWSKKPQILKIDNKQVAYQFAKIDTTFALHKKGSTFKRLTDGIRLYGTYSARHLDWYLEDINQDKYFTSSNSIIAHWGNKKFFDENINDTLRYTSYNDVEYLNSTLIVKEIMVK